MVRSTIVTLVVGILSLSGCSAPQKASTPDPAPPRLVLATSIKMACMDLAGYGKRIEKKDIEKLAGILKQEQVEILTVQGITRYPNVKTRVDFVGELAAQADMRHAFGESTDVMGRQLGNAVFSVYPIRSNQKKDYDVPSAFSEYALRVAIDAGAKDVTVVSTWLPEKAPANDISRCVQTIAGLQESPETPFVVSGNLPGLKQARNTEIFTDVRPALSDGTGRQPTSRMWYVQRDLFKIIKARTVKTDFGLLTVAEFGLYQQERPR